MQHDSRNNKHRAGKSRENIKEANDKYCHQFCSVDAEEEEQPSSEGGRNNGKVLLCIRYGLLRCSPIVAISRSLQSSDQSYDGRE